MSPSSEIDIPVLLARVEALERQRDAALEAQAAAEAAAGAEKAARESMQGDIKRLNDVLQRKDEELAKYKQREMKLKERVRQKKQSAQAAE
jgi:chromosome segregation ATPase